MSRYYFRLPLWLLLSLWYLHLHRPEVEAAPNWDMLALYAANLAMNLPAPHGRIETWIYTKAVTYLNQYSKEAHLAAQVKIVMTGVLPGSVEIKG